MPVGTQGSVRSQRLTDVEALNAPILLANTLHLMRRPGLQTLREIGGLHRLLGWKRAILTDSGGYQVFSLARTSVLDERGVRFRVGAMGHRGAAATPPMIDKSEPELFLSPETSIAAQLTIGSDIMMAFDQCIPSTAGIEQSRDAMERTHRWAERSLAARPGDSSAALFGIVQGACHLDLRRASALALGELCAASGRENGFDGLAIGGLAVGEAKSEREDMTAFTESFMPQQQPRYLMGVGTPIDLLEAVARGVDLFDCVLPTLFAQQGVAFTSLGKVDLRRGVYRLQERPLDPACGCDTCATHTRAYLRHLIKAREVSGWSAIAAHNLYFYTELMARMRRELDAGTFGEFYRAQRDLLAGADCEHPAGATPSGRRSRPVSADLSL